MKRTVAIFSILALSLSLSGSPARSQEASVEPQATQEAPAAKKPSNIKEWVSANRSRKGAVAGVIAGAILGGLLAHARGQDVARGAAAGAVVGGVTGYFVGRHRDKVQYGRDQAIQMAQYDPSQGYVIQIQSVEFDPQTIKPGETAVLHVRYLVIGPDPRETIRIKCYRGIKYQDSFMAGDEATLKVANGGGIIESTSEFTLPKEAPAGTYSAEALLEDTGGRFSRSGTSPLYIES
jgi:outer membrane lipoprotein SlyB